MKEFINYTIALNNETRTLQEMVLLKFLQPNDIALFMYWYHSLSGLCFSRLNIISITKKQSNKKKAEYLSMVSNQELNWFNEYYADKVMLV